MQNLLSLSGTTKNLITAAIGTALLSAGLFYLRRYFRKSPALKNSPHSEVNPPVISHPTKTTTPYPKIPEFKESESLVDGNTAVAHVAYSLSDTNFIYPVTPTGYLGEKMVSWDKKGNNKFLFGKEKMVKILETRNGASGVVHGATFAGALVSTCVPSEGLLMMLPNLPQIASTNKPVVFHVPVRSIGEDHSVNSDYSAIMATCSTGFAFFGSDTVQEAHDLAVIAHVASVRAQTPVLHFFDGVRVAPVVSKINLLSSAKLESLIQKDVVQYRTGSKPKISEFSTLVDSVMEELSEPLQHRYRPFEYVGHAAAEYVIVTMGSNSAIAEEYVHGTPEKFGIIKIRLFRPWSVSMFLSVLPKTVQHVAVLDQSKNSPLGWSTIYRDVAASLQTRPQVPGTPPLRVSAGTLAGTQVTPAVIKGVYDNMSGPNPKLVFTLDEAPMTSIPVPVYFLSTKFRQCSFWDVDIPLSVEAEEEDVSNEKYFSYSPPVKMISQILAQREKFLRLSVGYDAYCVRGAVNSVLRYGSGVGGESPLRNDYVACHQVDFLLEYDMLNSINDNGIFLVNSDPEKIIPVLPASVKRDLFRRKIQFYVVDANRVLTDVGGGLNDRLTLSLALQSVFFQLTYRDTTPLKTYLTSSGGDPRYLNVTDSAVSALRQIPIPSDWLDAQDDVEQPLSTSVQGSILPHSAYGRALTKVSAASKHRLTRMTSASLYMMFPHVYQARNDLRPVGGAHADTFRVKLTKTVRLTPDDYDRNIFHMEIDISGTGLKYDMGEALAVYGLNPAQQVDDFLSFYNLHPNDIVCVSLTPNTTLSSTEPSPFSIRSVFQIFHQYLDIFGRPSKRFYQTLAEHATDPVQKEKLLFIISENGKEEFKKRVEETTTYEDLLREFPSAHPSVESLLEMIPPIKPRHYSIASSMKVYPTSVHLLVVVEDWKTPSGKFRVGQCSGYLASLKNPETQDIYMTVSVAPSLMKLPPKNTQPVVMAGLGTGMAPFRAFIQERSYLASKGEDVGPMALYFGSRHRSKEYLYGDELEAYNASGLLKYLRLAFSRDQNEKVYIQHKLNNDKEEIFDLLLKEKGHFYLCGPTWPTVDVYDAIVNNFTVVGGMDVNEAKEEVYRMKEEGRYVLEVY